jgi:hypothetical protein
MAILLPANGVVRVTLAVVASDAPMDRPGAASPIPPMNGFFRPLPRFRQVEQDFDGFLVITPATFPALSPAAALTARCFTVAANPVQRS